METDTSNQAFSGIPSQYHIVNRVKQLYPTEYHGKTLNTTQRNWPIHDKELFAIVDSFRKWRDWLVGVLVNVYTDHQGLQYFNTKQKLNSQQASWYLKMSEFIYHIYYRPGSKIGKAHGLSRRSVEEISGIEARFFDEEQLLDLEEDDAEERREADYIELEAIDVAIWENNSGLWVVPTEHKLKVLT